MNILRIDEYNKIYEVPPVLPILIVSNLKHAVGWSIYHQYGKFTYTGYDHIRAPMLYVFCKSNYELSCNGSSRKLNDVLQFRIVNTSNPYTPALQFSPFGLK